MSKTNKRKPGDSKTISGNNNNNSSGSSSHSKEHKRPSVFERLGTKATVGSPSSVSLSINTTGPGQEFCRSWAQNGNCPYGKNCKLSNTHILISPSKRSGSKKEDLSVNLGKSSSSRISEEEKRLYSGLIRRVGSPELNSWETWDQNELEYEDEKVLEKRRQLLQRELDLHMKKDTRQDNTVKILRRSSSSSSCSSTSSGSSSSSVSSSGSSAVNSRSADYKRKRQSTSSPSDSEKNSKRPIGKLTMSKDSPPIKSGSSGSGSKKPLSPSRKLSRKKSVSPIRKLPPPPSPPKIRLSMASNNSSSSRRSPSSVLDGSNYLEKIPDSRYYSHYFENSTNSNKENVKLSSIDHSRRKETPERRSRGMSSDRKKHRSVSRSRRRGSSPRPVRRIRSPDSKLSSSSRRPTSRNRSIDRKRDDDRKSKDDLRRDKKSDFRDKRDLHEDSRSREKAREMREAAREKERTEALERCRERQREREAAAKEKERQREERERERKEANAKRNRARSERRRDVRRQPSSMADEKRHDRTYERYERKVPDRERSYDRERARDRALERVMERKSIDRSRERGRDSYESPFETFRRLIEDKPYSSPYRSERRYDTDRDRLSPRDDRIRSGYPDDRRKENRRDRVSGGSAWTGEGESVGGSRYDDTREKQSSRSDWDRDFQESGRRDWESRCRDEGEEWPAYSGGGSDWNSSSRPHGVIAHHEERRSHIEVAEKDRSSADTNKEKDTESLLGKRLGGRCSGDEMEEPAKRTRIEEASTSLQEELSDISDDADDILNREDIEFTEGDESRLEGENDALDHHIDESSQSHQQPQSPAEHRAAESRLTEDEGMVGLDFEEISDEELEEESKTNKGSSVGDALGVDWSSLMAGCKEEKKQLNQTSTARAHWETENVLARIGISVHMAGNKMVSALQEKYPQLSLKDDKKLTEVAALRRPLNERRSIRSQLLSSTLQHKQALSARADIVIRRQLCGLPVVSLETHQNIGFCQWAV